MYGTANKDLFLVAPAFETVTRCLLAVSQNLYYTARGMGGKAKAVGANERGSSTGRKRAVVDGVRYGPACLPKRGGERLVKTLGQVGWIAPAPNGVGGSEDVGESWELGPACGTVLAISVGREEVRCALARPDGRLLKEEHDRLYVEPPSRQRQASPSDFEETLARLVVECVVDGRPAPIVAVAAAWPGRVKPDLNEGRGDPHPRSYAGSWAADGTSLAASVAAALKRAGLEGDPPIYVLNDADANLMALAHSTSDDHAAHPDDERGPGLARIRELIESSTVTLGVTIAGGVGGALMFEPSAGARRTVQRGGHGFVGELGQITVDVLHPEAERTVNVKGLKKLAELKEDEKFPRWNCIYTETLDHYASGRSIVEQLYPKLEGGYNGRILDIKRRLDRGDGDPTLQQIMNRSGRLIGQALIGPTLAIDPDLIVVSSFAWSGDLLTGIRDGLASSTAYAGFDRAEVVLAPADPARTVRGAARWAIEMRISPYLDQVCAPGNGQLETYKKDLLERAIR